MSNYNADDELATDTYDANGNTAASVGQGSVYDFENHPIQGGDLTYTYDGDGKRVETITVGVTMQYTVDSQNPTGRGQALVDWRSDVGAKYYIYGLELLGETLDREPAHSGRAGRRPVHTLSAWASKPPLSHWNQPSC